MVNPQAHPRTPLKLHRPPAAPPVSDAAADTRTTIADAHDVSKTLAALERTLRDSLDAHATLADLLGEKKQALIRADNVALQQTLRRENEQVQIIAELEKARAATTAQLTLLVDPAAPTPRRLTELADLLPEPARGKLLVLRLQLRERMAYVKQQVDITRQATEHLSRHLDGLVRTIAAVSSGQNTYQRNGRRPDTPAMSTHVSRLNRSA